mgnify:CR=1 FL=1
MEVANYPKLKNAILLCLLIIILQIIIGLIAGIFSSITGISEHSPTLGIILSTVQILSFGIPLYIGWINTKKPFNEVFNFKKVNLDSWIYTIIFSTGFIIVSSEIDNFFKMLVPMPYYFDEIFGVFLNNDNLIIAIFLTGVIPAFIEEMTFRGLFISGFRINYSAKKTILFSALLFGIIHLNPWQFITAFIVGLVTGWIFLKSNSIILCVFIHFFNNTMFLLANRFENFIPVPGFNPNVASPNNHQPWWFNAMGISIAVIGLILLKRSFRKKF